MVTKPHPPWSTTTPRIRLILRIPNCVQVSPDSYQDATTWSTIDVEVSEDVRDFLCGNDAIIDGVEFLPEGESP